MPTKSEIDDIFEQQIPCNVVSINRQISAHQHLINVTLPNNTTLPVLLEVGYKLAVTSGFLKDIILSIHQQIFYQDQY